MRTGGTAFVEKSSNKETCCCNTVLLNTQFRNKAQQEEHYASLVQDLSFKGQSLLVMTEKFISISWSLFSTSYE